MSFFAEAGWVGWVQVATCVLGLLWTLVCAVLLGLKWKVPAVLATAPLALHALLVIVSAMVGGSAIDSVVGLDASQRATVYAYGIAQVLAGGALAAVVLPSAMLLGLGGAAGGARAPRGYGAPVVAFLACGLAAILPLGGLFFYASVPFAVAKLLLLGMGAFPVALSLLGNGQNSNARESSVATTIAYFSVAAALELADRSSSWLKVFSAIANADPEAKATLMVAAAEEIASVSRFGWMSLALAFVPILAAVLRPAAELSEEELMTGQVNPSGFRIIGTGLALVVPLLWFAALLAADPSAAMLKMAKP